MVQKTQICRWFFLFKISRYIAQLAKAGDLGPHDDNCLQRYQGSYSTSPFPVHPSLLRTSLFSEQDKEKHSHGSPGDSPVLGTAEAKGSLMAWPYQMFTKNNLQGGSWCKKSEQKYMVFSLTFTLITFYSTLWFCYIFSFTFSSGWICVPPLLLSPVAICEQSTFSASSLICVTSWKQHYRMLRVSSSFWFRSA